MDQQKTRSVDPMSLFLKKSNILTPPKLGFDVVVLRKVDEKRLRFVVHTASIRHDLIPILFAQQTGLCFQLKDESRLARRFTINNNIASSVTNADILRQTMS